MAFLEMKVKAKLVGENYNVRVVRMLTFVIVKISMITPNFAVTIHRKKNFKIPGIPNQ